MIEPQYEDSTKPPRMVKFDPTLTSGTLIEIIVILAGIAGLYNTITNQQAKTEVEINYMTSIINQEKAVTQRQLMDLKTDVKDIQKSLTNVEVGLARLQPTDKK